MDARWCPDPSLRPCVAKSLSYACAFRWFLLRICRLTIFFEGFVKQPCCRPIDDRQETCAIVARYRGQRTRSASRSRPDGSSSRITQQGSSSSWRVANSAKAEVRFSGANALSARDAGSRDGPIVQMRTFTPLRSASRVATGCFVVWRSRDYFPLIGYPR